VSTSDVDIVAVRWTSLQDFPDRVSAVLWTRGCNLRCPFCYNAQLVLPELSSRLAAIPPESVLDGLEARKGFLDGVVFTGGEPTLHADLAPLSQEVKGRGFQVKLDTNGTRPDMLERLLVHRLVDYVSLDIKAPPNRYEQYSGPVERSQSELVARVEEALNLLRVHGIAYEARTTAAPGLGPQELHAIARWIMPVPRYVLQPFVCPTEARLIEDTLRKEPALAPDRLQEVAAELSSDMDIEVRA